MFVYSFSQRHKDWMMIRIGEWVNVPSGLLVPAHPGSPGQRVVKTVVVAVVVVYITGD